MNKVYKGNLPMIHDTESCVFLYTVRSSKITLVIIKLSQCMMFYRLIDEMRKSSR